MRRDPRRPGPIQAVAGRPSGIVVADAAGVVDHVNHRFIALTGIGPEDLSDLVTFASAVNTTGAEPFRGMRGCIAGASPGAPSFRPVIVMGTIARSRWR